MRRLLHSRHGKSNLRSYRPF